MSKFSIRTIVKLTLMFIPILSVDGRSFGPSLRHTNSSLDSQPKLPADLNLVDWKQIRAEYERHRHGMFPDGKGGYQSRTHYHGWLAKFDGRGFEVKPDTEPWTWGLELVSWGREGNQIPVSGKAEIHTDVNRLEYRRPGITEWFVNGKEGLEHGFTIKHRPGGGEGELSLQLRQRGELVAAQDPVADQESARRSVLYKTAQGAALHYRKLLVTDARGRRLPARMVAEGERLRILVDDRRAVYPIVVDPITQQAYLKASNTGAGDNFGFSVAIDGDTVVGVSREDGPACGRLISLPAAGEHASIWRREQWLADRMRIQEITQTKVKTQ